MNRKMTERIMEAGKYQKMAVKALFPEEKQAHLEIISRELKQLFTESLFECVMECAANMASPERKNEASKPDKEQKCKKDVTKVTIS